MRRRIDGDAGVQIRHIVIDRDQELLAQLHLADALISRIGVIGLGRRACHIGHILMGVVRIGGFRAHIKPLIIHRVLPF